MTLFLPLVLLATALNFQQRASASCRSNRRPSHRPDPPAVSMVGSARPGRRVFATISAPTAVGPACAWLPGRHSRGFDRKLPLLQASLDGAVSAAKACASTATGWWCLHPTAVVPTGGRSSVLCYCCKWEEDSGSEYKRASKKNRKCVFVGDKVQRKEAVHGVQMTCVSKGRRMAFCHFFCRFRNNVFHMDQVIPLRT